ncbi:hypothetical protein [Cellulomonas soli]|uniref:Uncharacterized protein n=1 Tax=Cellulomonas soli TaxID=931535 RepID=A0A512PHI1_9CELL|nr:hypothetical protein [Cellulomonas soli]NYI59152.1 hypothetical protein [Cellulomonas soli]GEP70655.1 hypothetical protein CSO01_33700 [Cellulomonas soli]
MKHLTRYLTVDHIHAPDPNTSAAQVAIDRWIWRAAYVAVAGGGLIALVALVARIATATAH